MKGKWSYFGLQLVLLFILSAIMTACGARTPTPTVLAPSPSSTLAPSVVPSATRPLPTMGGLIPRPVSVTPTYDRFLLTPETDIYVSPLTEETRAVAHFLSEQIRTASGYDVSVLPAQSIPSAGNFYLTLEGADLSLGKEGYELTITPQLVTLRANQPVGLFYGIQTIRQLLPAAIESPTPKAGPWEMATGVIRDYPRFAWRGAMLDVARHFFTIEEVKRYIDYLAYYKMNRLHLHLTDDQGWRIEIKSWPKLASYGGSLEVGGTRGGYYTQEQYTELVTYAADRYVMVIPEIDMPGHVNAALASYPELNCDDVAPDLYTGTEVGFSSLCVYKDITYTFLQDVVREIASLTPGPYIHMGGDEALSTKESAYKYFIRQVQAIVAANGKRMIGWEEVAQAKLLPDTLIQHWRPGEGHVREAIHQGALVIMSPADKAYLDMKYDPSTRLGLSWAGYINVQTAYAWDPAQMIPNVGEEYIVGIEAPLWSETVTSLDDIEYLAFPRLAGYAEIGWSPVEGKDWAEYRWRLASHAPRWQEMGIDFYRSPEVLWP